MLSTPWATVDDRPLVGRLVADQVRPVARNGLSPGAGLLFEGIDPERVDLVADEAGDHGLRPRVLMIDAPDPGELNSR